jgi:hypothetical protein
MHMPTQLQRLRIDGRSGRSSFGGCCYFLFAAASFSDTYCIFLFVHGYFPWLRACFVPGEEGIDLIYFQAVQASCGS